MKYYDFKSEKQQQWKQELKAKVDKTEEWAHDNRELLIAGAPVMFATVKAVTKFTTKQINMKKQQSLKELYCYDRSLGHYWRLKRELTNFEWLEIESRKQRGEKLADILVSLKVLK